MRSVLLAATVLATSAADCFAQADALPLRRGAYVRVDTPCPSASNGTLATFDGRGFGVVQGGCRITQLRRDGPAYLLTEACESRDGRATRRSRVTLEGPEAYTMVNEYGTFRMRYCTPASLPAFLRPYGEEQRQGGRR